MRRWLALLLILVLLLQPAALFADTLAEKQQELENVQRQLEEAQQRKTEYEKQAAALEKELEALDAELNQISSEIHAYEQQLAKTRAEIKDVEEDLAIIDRNRREKQARIAELEQALAEQEAALSSRVRFLYQKKELSFVSFLLSVKSFSEFIEGFALVSRVIASDRQLIEKMSTTKAELEQAKEELDVLYAARREILAEKKKKEEEVSFLLAQLKRKRSELDYKLNEKERLLRQAVENKEYYEKLEEELEELSKKLEKEIWLLQQQQNNPVFTGAFIRPLDWSLDGIYISSYFGYRYHPILHTRKFHSGLDIAAPYGTPIRAAQSGTVLRAVYSDYGYGNYVILDHGNGVSTLYAHCSVLAVEPGQLVKQGDIIAYVGSSGLSTGPHLHFEVRVEGVPQNPLNYLP